MGQKWKKNKASTVKAFVPSSHPWGTPRQAASTALFYRMCGSWSGPLPVHPGGVWAAPTTICTRESLCGYSSWWTVWTVRRSPTHSHSQPLSLTVVLVPSQMQILSLFIKTFKWLITTTTNQYRGFITCQACSKNFTYVKSWLWLSNKADIIVIKLAL